MIEKWQRFAEGTDAWPTVFLENHDLPRAITKYASDKEEHVAASAKTLALMEVGLTGTLYIYQGQEIGMTNVPKTWGHEEYKDVIAVNYYAMLPHVPEMTPKCWQRRSQTSTGRAETVLVPQYNGAQRQMEASALIPALSPG